LDSYKLDGKNIIKCRDILEWAEYFEMADRHVADETVWGIRISTIFLGIDHGFSLRPDAIPVLFETMVFVGRRSQDEYTERYCTYEEAEAGHIKIVEHIKHHPIKLVVAVWVKHKFFSWGNRVLEILWLAKCKAQSVFSTIINWLEF